MAPEALTAERVYHELKRLIITGRYGAGAPIVLASAADQFSTSISPVRDALNRLVGDRLVESQAGGGFNVPTFTLSAIRQLYSWHAELTRLAVKSMSRAEPVDTFPGLDRSSDRIFALSLADTTAALFGQIAARTDNLEYQSALASAGQRLHRFRLCETLFKNVAAEIETLWNLTRNANKNQLRVAMWHYHHRRLLKIDAILSAAGGRSKDEKDE